MLNSNRLQYLLAKEVESAFEGNKNMLMRKTVKGDEGSPEGKRIRQFTERGFKERTDVNPPHSFFQILDKKKLSAGVSSQMCLLMLHHTPAVMQDMTISLLLRR